MRQRARFPSLFKYFIMFSARFAVQLSVRATWTRATCRSSSCIQRKYISISPLSLCKDKRISTDIALENQKSPLTVHPRINLEAASAAQLSARVEYLGFNVYPGGLERISPKCYGCGAVFQSAKPENPGYVIESKNPALQDIANRTDVSKPVVCQRCFNMQQYNRGTPVNVTSQDVTEFLGHIARRKALILYVVDVIDLPGSLLPGLPDIVGPAKRVIVVGNKLDMLPLDGKSRVQLERLKSVVLQQCMDYGLQDANVKDICLISAKTGFGIPQLISKILTHWDAQGDIYLVGSNNTGKTSLFNTLMDLTNVHKKNGDMVNRATVSHWPGTTLSLLRFTCGSWKLTKLKHRLQDGTNTKDKKEFDDKEEYDIDADIIDKQETSHKGTTTCTNVLSTIARENTQNSLDIYKPEIISSVATREHQSWFYDTPGIMNENQITNYLTMEELKLLHSNLWMVPRTFILKPGQAFLLGGLARVDFVEINRQPRPQDEPDQTLAEPNKSVYFTIFSSPNLPIHVLNLSKAQEFYNTHAGKQLLKIPCGSAQRMASFPELQSLDFIVTGIGWKESAADIVLSNIGWVSVTAGQQANVVVRGFTPNGKGLQLRQPALLPTCVNQRGKRGASYQGHPNPAAYDSHRNGSPQLVKCLSFGHHGVYQWLREAKRRKQQQTALLKERNINRIIDKSLAAEQRLDNTSM